jgi:hypothetical protein
VTQTIKKYTFSEVKTEVQNSRWRNAILRIKERTHNLHAMIPQAAFAMLLVPEWRNPFSFWWFCTT